MTSESEMEVKFHHLRLANNNQNRNAKETLLTLVREKLVIEKSETCPSWLSKLPPIPPNELDNILTTYTSSFEDFAQHTEDIESDLKYAAVETLSKRCVQIYILILQKNFNEVGSILLEAYNLTDYCITQKYFSHEYADGFRFVLKTLEIFWTIENEKEVEKLNVETLARYVEDLNGFEKLNVKNKVGVLALKVYFLGKIIRGKSYEEQIEIVKQIIDMDPNNSEWHVCHYFLSKFLRVSIDTYGPPSEQEKNAILAAVELQEKEELDSRILIGQITCLAEILRNDLKNNVQSPLQFGKHSFDSADEVVQFIKMEAEKIVSIDPISVRSNVNLAKIFSSILPYQVQDRDFAKTCIERAIQYYPNSSKANHRMGVFYLSSTTGIEQALGYMKKAYETDQRNIFAVLDLLRIYMGDVDKNEQELKDTFHTAVSSKFFQGVPKNFSDLLFTKAIYEFLRGREIECVDLLLEAQGTDEKAKEFFKEVYRFVKRFKWYQNLNGKNILGRIQQLLASSLNEGNYSVDSVRKRQLKELCEAAKIAQDSIKVNTGFAGRGRGGLRISSGIETESRERMGLEFVSEGSRDGYVPRGFTGRGSRRGRGQGGPRGRGIFPRNTDNNYHSNINAHRDDDANSNWRSGDNQHPQSVKTADHEIVTTRPPLSPSVCSKGSIKDEIKEPELPGIVFRTTQQDHHQTLGVAKTATKAEMKKVYLKLAREYHPDRNTHLSEIDREAKQKQMERINEAWDFLQRMSN